MNILKTLCPSLAVVLLLMVAQAGAGELHPQLADSLAKLSGDQPVAVWISVVKLDQTKSVKAAALAHSQYRKARYEFAMQKLKTENPQSQQRLLQRLGELELHGKAARVKSRWIANVVEAELPPSEIRALVDRDDVELIALAMRPQLIVPEDKGTPPVGADADAVAAHLTHIRADSAWALGYTGLGRVVCSFDNGVEGTHSALVNTWKGKDGDSAAAWFDPKYRAKAPHVDPSPKPGTIQGHGTHTMGLMVGKSATQTVGVAYDAKWISAAVIDIDGASLLQAFEWAADPDGDPNSLDDVPDVINHSWGYGGPSYPRMACLPIFYEAIDNTEALGIVNIFAAGNSGGQDSTIYNPADGARDTLDCFAVGGLDITTNPATRSASSSQGPSTCFFNAVKPNVMAPGQVVLSSLPNNTFGTLTGTSMAAPQVSGLVALLRQKNPNTTADEIKLAILNSTKRTGFGGIPNNQYGWGEIDCVGALNAIGTAIGETNVRLYAFEHTAASPGSTIKGAISLKNIAGNATGVLFAIIGTDPRLTIIDGASFIGTINAGQVVKSTDSLTIQILPTAKIGERITLAATITANGIGIPATLTITLPPTAGREFVTHNTGRIEFSLSNYGVFGMGPGSLYPHGGVGFEFDNLGNDLWEGGLMLESSVVKIVSGVHEYINEPRPDFAVAPGGELELSQPGALADQQTTSAFTDANAENPINVLIRQLSYAYNSPDNDFIILRYGVTNLNGLTLSGLRLGLFLDWDIAGTSSDAGAWDATDSILWMADNTGTTIDPNLTKYRGLILLEGNLAQYLTDDAVTAYNPWVAANADGYHPSEKYQDLVSVPANPTQYATAKADLFQVMATGPMSISAGGSDTVAFAIVAGSSLNNLKSAAQRARTKYANISTSVDDDDDGNLPTAFTLYQNYPNPFNPATTIAFNLPQTGQYSVEVFNLLGQEVWSTEGRAAAGYVEVIFSGEELASGVYLYRVNAGSFSESRKMMLLK